MQRLRLAASIVALVLAALEIVAVIGLVLIGDFGWRFFLCLGGTVILSWAAVYSYRRWKSGETTAAPPA